MQTPQQDRQETPAQTEAPKSTDLLDGINTREELEAKLFMIREEPKVLEPQPPTLRQVTNREAEMAAGKRALERHEAAYKHRGTPERSAADIAAEGSSAPVKTDDTFVPNFDQGKPGTRGQSRTIR